MIMRVHLYMCRFGPLVCHWTMRFEAKHKWFKRLAQQLGNFTNLPYTLSMRYQQQQCYQLCDGEDVLAEQLEVGPGSLILQETIPSLVVTTTHQVYRYITMSYMYVDVFVERGCVYVCVLFGCMCVYARLYSVAWQPKFQRPISLSTSGFGDCKVARVGRPATEYKLVVRPWESGIRPCISCHFPTV